MKCEVSVFVSQETSQATNVISLHVPQRPSQTVRGKAVPVHAITAYRGSRVITPPILNLGARRLYLLGQHHVPAALSPEENTGTYLIEGSVGPRSGHRLLKKKNLLSVTGFEPRILFQKALNILHNYSK